MAAAMRAALSYHVEGLAADLENIAFADDAIIPAVVIPSLRRLELVIDDSTDLTSLARLLPEHFPDTAWAVWVLSPLDRLADTHAAFGPSAGCVERVQGWWLRPDDSVTFTEPQLP